MNPRDFMVSEVEKIYRAADEAEAHYKRERIERLKDESYKQSQRNELQRACLCAIERLADAAQNPFCARKQIKEARNDITRAQVALEALDPEWEEQE